MSTTIIDNPSWFNDFALWLSWELASIKTGKNIVQLQVDAFEALGRAKHSSKENSELALLSSYGLIRRRGSKNVVVDVDGKEVCQ